MFNWRERLLKQAVTTEDRLWKFVGENASELSRVANDPNMNNEAKKQTVLNYYDAIREAFKQLGVIR